MNADKPLRSFLIVYVATVLPAASAWAADTLSPNVPAEKTQSIETTAPVSAKVTFGTIAGILRTQAGLPLGAATVTAARLDGSGIRATISGSDGIYSFADVLPGAYSVTAQADGYPDGTAPSALVTAGRATRVDIAIASPPAA